MPDTKSDIRRGYPLPAYNFRVTVQDAEPFRMGFQEVAGIAIEHERLVYRHGLSFWEGEQIKTFLYPKPVSITMSRGAVLDQKPLFLYRWMQRRASLGLEVDLCDELGQPVICWKIAKAQPVKLEAPSFDTGSNDPAIETLELMASGISVVLRQAEPEAAGMGG